MQNKKKGIQKSKKTKNVSHKNKKKSQNENKFSKNGNFCHYFRACWEKWSKEWEIKENSPQKRYHHQDHQQKYRKTNDVKSNQRQIKIHFPQRRRKMILLSFLLLIYTQTILFL